MANTRPDFLAMASVRVQDPIQAKAQESRQRFILGIDRWTGIICVYILKNAPLLTDSNSLKMQTQKGEI